MTVDSSAEIIQRQEAQEKPVVVSFRTGTSPEGLPEYLSFPYEDVVKGNLTKRQALYLLRAAEFGTNELRLDLETSGSSLTSPTLVPARSFVEATNVVFRSLSKTISQEMDESIREPQQREIIQDIFTACKQGGVLNTDMLTRAVEAEFMRSQQEEKTRQEKVARMNRLNRLGFLVGFADTITGFFTSEELVEFPHVNQSLPEEKRWPDAVKRAEEAGFTFDEEGRVAGFKAEDGKTATIPEADRSQQITIR